MAKLDNRTKASNLVRSFNLAGTIVANSPGAQEADVPAVAAAVGELASALYAEQNALFEAEELTAEAPAAKTGGGGWTGSSGGSSGDGATDKQVSFAGRLIAEIQEAGGTPDVDIDDVKGLSKSDASDAISKLKEKADDLKSGGPF
jgi:hypothetical protein